MRKSLFHCVFLIAPPLTHRGLALILNLACLGTPWAQAQEVPPKPRIVDENAPAPSVLKAKPVEPVMPERPPTVRPALAAPDAAPPALPDSKKTPAASNPDEDLFNYAYMLYKREANQLAVDSFGKYIGSYPKGKRVDAAFTLKGECHRRLGQVVEAVSSYQEVLARYQSGQWLGYAARQLGTLAYNDNRPADSARFYKIAAAQAPKGDEKVQYLYYEGLSLKRIDKLKEAALVFESALKVTGLASAVFQDQSHLELARYEMEIKKATARERFEKLGKTTGSLAIKAEAIYTVGILAMEKGDTAGALSHFDAVAKITGVEKWPSLARAAQIRAYAAAEEYKKVTDAWSRLDIKAVVPEARPSLLLAVGDSFRLQSVFASAAEIYGMIEQFYNSSPEAPTAAYRKLVCLYKQKDAGVDAIAARFIEQEKARNAESESIDMAFLMQAEDHFGKQNWEQAAKCYKEIRPTKISDDLRAGLFYRKGRAEAESGAHPAAVDSLTQFLTSNPQDSKIPEVTFRRAMSYLEMKDLTNALKDFDTVSENHEASPVHQEAARFSALLRGQNKDFEGMITRFQVLLTKHPDTKYAGEAYFWIGTAHYNLKKWKECLEPLARARESYREQLEDIYQKRIVAYTYLEDLDSLQKEIDAFNAIQPKGRVNAEIVGYLGSKRYTEQNFADAAKFLGQAVEAPQSNLLKPIIWFQLAESRLKMNEFANVVPAIDKYFEIAGEIAPDRRAKAMLLRGRANLGLGKHDAAKADADTGLKLRTQDVNESRLYHLRGDIEQARGNRQEGRNNFMLVAQLGPFDEVAADAFRKLIVLLDQLGETETAAKIRGEYKQKFPNEPEIIQSGGVKNE